MKGRAQRIYPNRIFPLSLESYLGVVPWSWKTGCNRPVFVFLRGKRDVNRSDASNEQLFIYFAGDTEGGVKFLRAIEGWFRCNVA